MTSAERSKRIGQLVEMAKNATPGPWERHDGGEWWDVRDAADEPVVSCGYDGEVTTGYQDAALIAAAPEMASLLQEYEAELATARETNRRLNDRCQQYEAGLAEKIAAGRAENRNLGRALANAAAERAEGHLARAVELLRDALPGSAILCESKEWEGDLSGVTGIGDPVPPCGECWTCRALAFLAEYAAQAGKETP